MPRRQLGKQPPRSVGHSYVEQLANELKSNRAFGQPMIYEERFDGGRLRTTVVWDLWAGMSFEDRTSVIIDAYSQAEGADFPERIVLASGLTVPEAESSGMLPFHIIAALRKDDPVTIDQCREAMIEVGASVLLDPTKPQLRLATGDEAEALRDELIKLLPGSEQVWIISQDVGKVDDWLRN